MAKVWSELSEDERTEAYMDAQDMIRDYAKQVEILEEGINKLHELAVAYDMGDVGPTVFSESTYEQIEELWNRVNPDGEG